MPGTLYIVPTPIGNLEDMTPRAVRVLREVDVIACEDTRHTQKLLNHFDIRTRTVSYHEHNERERAEELCKLLREEKSVALVSDAGTPLVSDPGFRLVALAVAAEVPIVPLPGPAAFIAALSAAGLPSDQFFFAGFLPARATARRARLAELESVPGTLVFYEAPHRIAAALRDALSVFGDRAAVVARELTKIHEEFVRGKLSELAATFGTNQKPRGEMVLIIGADNSRSGKDHRELPADSLIDRVSELEKEGLDFKAALKRAARELGLKRDEAYRLMLECIFWSAAAESRLCGTATPLWISLT
jgi:16S rRNA (cytidine1402-2'-O)-methyltransferase